MDQQGPGGAPGGFPIYTLRLNSDAGYAAPRDPSILLRPPDASAAGDVDEKQWQDMLTQAEEEKTTMPANIANMAFGGEHGLISQYSAIAKSVLGRLNFKLDATLAFCLGHSMAKCATVAKGFIAAECVPIKTRFVAHGIPGINYKVLENFKASF